MPFVLVLHYLVILTLVSYHFRVQEDHPIMSFTISKNGRLALLNVATQVSWGCWKETEINLLATATCF